MNEIGYVEIDGKNYLVTVRQMFRGNRYKLVKPQPRLIPREARSMSAVAEHLKNDPDKASALLRGEIVSF